MTDYATDREDRIKIANEQLSALLLQGNDDLHQALTQDEEEGEGDSKRKIYVDWPENDDDDYRFVGSRVEDYPEDTPPARSQDPYDSLEAEAYEPAPPPPPDQPVRQATNTSSSHHYTPLSHNGSRTSIQQSQKRASQLPSTVTPMPEPRHNNVASDEEEALLLEEELRYQSGLKQRLHENELRDQELEIPPLQLAEMEESSEYLHDDVMEISVRSNAPQFAAHVPSHKMPAGVARLSDFVHSLDDENDRWEEKNGEIGEGKVSTRRKVKNNKNFYYDDDDFPYNGREDLQLLNPREEARRPREEAQRQQALEKGRSKSLPNPNAGARHSMLPSPVRYGPSKQDVHAPQPLQDTDRHEVPQSPYRRVPPSPVRRPLYQAHEPPQHQAYMPLEHLDLPAKPSPHYMPSKGNVEFRSKQYVLPSRESSLNSQQGHQSSHGNDPSREPPRGYEQLRQPPRDYDQSRGPPRGYEQSREPPRRYDLSREPPREYNHSREPPRGYDQSPESIQSHYDHSREPPRGYEPPRAYERQPNRPPRAYEPPPCDYEQLPHVIPRSNHVAHTSPTRNNFIPHERYPTDQNYPDSYYPEQGQNYPNPPYPGNNYPYGEQQLQAPNPPKSRLAMKYQNEIDPDTRLRHYGGQITHKDAGSSHRSNPAAIDRRPSVRNQASSPFSPPDEDYVRRRRFSDASLRVKPDHKLRQSHKSTEEIYTARREALKAQYRKQEREKQAEKDEINYVERNKQTYGFTQKNSGYAKYYTRKQQEQQQSNSAPSRFSRKPPLPNIKPRSQRDEADDSESERDTDPENLWARRSKALFKRAVPHQRKATRHRTESVPDITASAGESYNGASTTQNNGGSTVQNVGNNRIQNQEPQKVSIDLNVNITPQGFQISDTYGTRNPPDTYGTHSPAPAQGVHYIRPYADPYVLDKAFRSPRDLALQEKTPSDLDRLVYSHTTTNPFTPLPPISNSNYEEDEEEPVVGGYLARYRKDQNIKHGAEKRLYKPYSYTDYKRMPKDVKLGGLGPDLDNETHKEKLEKRFRAEEYARQAHQRNIQRQLARPTPEKQAAQDGSSSSPYHSPLRDVFTPTIVVKPSGRQAAIDYAKRLHRPSSKTKPNQQKPAKKPKEKPEPEMIDLKRLLERHERDKENVATVRAKLLEV